MNLLAKAKLSLHKRSIPLLPFTTATLQQCNLYATKATYSSQKTQQPTKPKVQKSSEPSSFTQRVKKQVDELTTPIWPKPREIPYQAKVANFVNLIGNVKTPVQFESAPDGKHMAATVISQGNENNRNSLLIPVVFEGNLAHVVACHVKENDCVFVSGQLSIDPMRFSLSESFGKFHVMAENLNFVEGFNRNASIKKLGLMETRKPVKATVIEDVVEVNNVDDDFNQQWKDALEHAKENMTLKVSPGNSVEVKTYAETPPVVASESRVDETKLEKDSEKPRESAVKKDMNAIVDLWRDVVKNPLQWWDYRGHKANGLVKEKYPDFKQKGSGESLWLNTAPSWVLPGLEMLEFDVKEMTGGIKKDAAVKGGDSLKSLVEDPSKWWDNRARKSNPRQPDFKHKMTGEVLWVEKLPDWALAKLPGLGKLESDVKEMAGGAKKDVAAKGVDSWKSLVEDPSKWWDNRAHKLNPRQPDFKHKETGEVIWVNKLPDWALAKLPPIEDGKNRTGSKIPQKFGNF